MPRKCPKGRVPHCPWSFWQYCWYKLMLHQHAKPVTSQATEQMTNLLDNISQSGAANQAYIEPYHWASCSDESSKPNVNLHGNFARTLRSYYLIMPQLIYVPAQSLSVFLLLGLIWLSLKQYAEWLQKLIYVPPRKKMHPSTIHCKITTMRTLPWFGRTEAQYF